MKIIILSRRKSIYSTSRLVEAGKKRGHEVRVIDPLHCFMNIASHRPMVYYKSEALEGFDQDKIVWRNYDLNLY